MTDDKIHSLNIQHAKEARIYDKAHAWTDVEHLTHESVKDITLDPNKTVMLDVASGTGRVAVYFKDKVKVVIGLDISKEMLSVAQQNNNFHVGMISPAEKTPFLDNSFDLLCCRSALHYMDVPKAIAEWIRISKNEAWIIVSDVSFEDEAVNSWYDTFLKIVLPETTLISHHIIMDCFKKFGQLKVEYKLHMIRGDLNDLAVRKHISDEKILQIKKMFREAPEKVKQVMNTEERDNNIFFDYGLTITRCNIKK